MKNTFKKSAAFAVAAILSLGALTGCGDTSDKAADNSASPSADAQTSDKIVMGTNAEFPPFEFKADEGQGVVGDFDGIDIAISKKIAEKLGKELVVEDMQFEGLIASVQSGKVDFAAAGMTANDERRQSVDFSDTYYVAEQVMVVKEDSSITKAEDLKNVDMVGVVMGYTSDSIVTDDLQIDENKILRVSRGIDGVQEVKNGKLDAMVIDSAAGEALAKENGLKVVKDDDVFAAEEYAIAVKKGNKELLDTINGVLKEMKDNGEIDALAQKYNG